MPITKQTSAGEIIKDFEQSDAPQFKGKSKEKIRQMALAAFMSKQNESVELDEGVSRQHPIEGHSYHSKTNDQLHFIIKDAGAAAKAQKGMSSEGKYLDQVNDASTVLGFRKRAAHPKTGNLPNWYLDKYFPRAGVKESVELEETVAGGELVSTWEFNPPKNYKGSKVGDRHIVKHGSHYAIHADDDQYSQIHSGSLSDMMNKLKMTHKPKLPVVKESVELNELSLNTLEQYRKKKVRKITDKVKSDLGTTKITDDASDERYKRLMADKGLNLHANAVVRQLNKEAVDHDEIRKRVAASLKAKGMELMPDDTPEEKAARAERAKKPINYPTAGYKGRFVPLTGPSRPMKEEITLDEVTRALVYKAGASAAKGKEGKPFKDVIGRMQRGAIRADTPIEIRKGGDPVDHAVMTDKDTIKPGTIAKVEKSDKKLKVTKCMGPQKYMTTQVSEEMGGMNMKDTQPQAVISHHGKEGYAVTHKGETTHHDTHEAAKKHAQRLSFNIHDVTESVELEEMSKTKIKQILLAALAKEKKAHAAGDEVTAVKKGKQITHVMSKLKTLHKEEVELTEAPMKGKIIPPSNPNHPKHAEWKAAQPKKERAKKEPEVNPVTQQHLNDALGATYPDTDAYDHLAKKFPHLHNEPGRRGSKLMDAMHKAAGGDYHKFEKNWMKDVKEDVELEEGFYQDKKKQDQTRDILRKAIQKKLVKETTAAQALVKRVTELGNEEVKNIPAKNRHIVSLPHPESGEKRRVALVSQQMDFDDPEHGEYVDHKGYHFSIGKNGIKLHGRAGKAGLYKKNK